MKKGKKRAADKKQRIWSFMRLWMAALAVVLCGVNSTAVTACAQTMEEWEGEAHVYDETGLLAPEDAARLEQLCGKIEKDRQIHILLAMTEDTRGKSPEAYADDFYDDRYPKTQDENGMVVLIDMGAREMWISTAGVMRYYLNDREIDRILDLMYEAVSDSDYAGAMEQAIREAEQEIEKGISSGDYLIDENGRVHRYRRITAAEALIAAAVGAGVFCAVFFGVRRAYRGKHSETGGYARTVGPHIENRRDTLIDRHVTVRRIPKNPPSGGGGSTVHTSSSGRSHGGGGRSF